jgi:hypothetical protein
MIDLHAIARHYGGTVTGGQALIPTIGHSAKDRGTAIKADASAPDGCLVHCFNGGDPLAEKDRLRADGFLPKPEPKADIGPWEPVATFEYANAKGEVIYRTVRRQPANWQGPGKRPKEFRAERREGARWVCGMGDCERVPYRLPKLRQAIDAGETVFLVEGEAKADKLASWGFPATAVAFGARGWRAEYAQHFKGARVIILPDNDEAGRDFARKVCADLKAVAAPCVVELPGLPPKGDIMDWQGSAAELEALCDNPAPPAWLHHTEGAAVPRPASAFQFIAVGDLEYRPPEYLIDGLIETETLGLLFGDPGCGKSFLGADIGLSVATGTPFHGRKVKQGPVFLIAGEGHNGLARRFAAWAKDREVSITGAPLFMSNRPAQFLDRDSAREVAEAVHGLAAQHGPPALIEIDTLARNYGPGDENSTSDMSAFIAAIDDLKAQFPGCAVLIIHHSGHSDKQRARGAIALKAALDFEYRVEKSDGLVRLMSVKMKDAEPPAPLAFELKHIDLGNGASSAVLVQTDAPARQPRLTKAQRFGIATFLEAARQKNSIQLELSEWQAVYCRRNTADKMDSKLRAFRRVRKELVEADVLSVADNVYRAECPQLIMELQSFVS